MVRAFAGDSTITSGLGTCEILVGMCSSGPTGGVGPHRGATNRVPVSNIPFSFPASKWSRTVQLSLPDHGSKGPHRDLRHNRPAADHLRRIGSAARSRLSRRLIAFHGRPSRVAGKVE